MLTRRSFVKGLVFVSFSLFGAIPLNKCKCEKRVFEKKDWKPTHWIETKSLKKNLPCMLKGNNFIEDIQIDQMIAKYPAEVPYTKIVKEFKSFFIVVGPVTIALKDCDCYTITRMNPNESD